MLRLRREHLEAFEKQAVSQFTARVVSHVRAVWPIECAELGDSLVNETVQNAIQRAVRAGFNFEYDVVRFVDLSFILAKDFETNPQAAWTSAILSDPKLSPTAKMDKLYRLIEEELARKENRKGIPA